MQTVIKAPNVQLNGPDSVEAVLKELTLEEKLYLLTGGSGFGTCAVERLGIPAAMMVDSAAGINLAQYFGDLYSRIQIREGKPFKSLAGVTNTEETGAMITAISEGRELEGEAAERYQKICKERRKITDVDELPTCFPTGMLLGSTWNPETVEQCGRAVGREARCFGVNILMGSPDANIQRDPRGGRVFECYTEDPCVMSTLAPAMVRGVQSEGVFANAKHFAANNQETARLKINETISERALREIYFPGFRACVEQSGLKTIMCAYNHINGVGCSMNRWLLRDVLRGEWGFKGMVMSDWGGVYDQVQAVRAGNDLDMPGVRDMAPVREALENGQLSMEEVDFCVRNILTSLAENPSLQEPSRKKLDKCFSAEAAYHAAVEGFVLLKNDGALPLREPCKLALFGEGCKQFITTSRQSSRVFSYKQPRLLEELETRLGKDNVRFEELPTHADAVLITVQSLGTEGKDRPDLQIDAEQREMLERGLDAARRAGAPAILLLNIAAPIDISSYVERVDAIIAVYYPGIEGARALADVLLGKISPSGHLSITYPRRVEDCPAYGFFPGASYSALYNEDIYVGYRYYDLKDVSPLYPFGHGLSYTTFALSNARLDVAQVNQDFASGCTLYVDIENTGDCDAKAVVQVYLHHASNVLPRPVRELKAFQKPFLRKGEKRTLSFRLSIEQLAAFDPRFHQWIAEPGEYVLEAGFSSRDLRVRTALQVSGHTPYDYGKHTPLRQIAANPAAYAALLENFAPFDVTRGDFEDCLKYFPDKELGVIVQELLVNKHLSGDDPKLCAAISQIYDELKNMQPVLC